MSKKWTIEETERLKSLYSEGVPDAEIGEVLQRTKNAINLKRNKLGIIDIHKRRFTDEGKQKMKDVRKNYTKEKAPSWKGGRRVSANGYIEVHLPDHHRARGNGYVFEHILVAEKKFGREITQDEHVHHVDENKQNNDPNNLEVISPGEHSRITGLSRRKGEYKKCLFCGSEYYTKPSHVKRSKYCSKPCHARGVGLSNNRRKIK